MQTAPGRPSLQGGASDLQTGSQVWGLQCTPSSYTVPGQFYQIGSHMALCPPLPCSSTPRPWLPGPRGAHMHPGLPWPGLDEHSLVLNFPGILIVVSSPQEAGALSVRASQFLFSLLTLVFSLLPSSSLLAFEPPVLPVCLGFSSSSLHLSPPVPLCAFSWQTPNGKHLFPGALQQSLLLLFLRHPANPAPRAGFRLPAIAANAEASSPEAGGWTRSSWTICTCGHELRSWVREAQDIA